MRPERAAFIGLKINTMSQICAEYPDNPFVPNTCPGETGGYIACGFIRKATYEAWIDLDDAAEWAAAIAAETVYAINPVTGELPGEEWNTQPGYGELEERNTSINYTTTFTCPAVNELTAGVYTNREFWNAIAKQSGSYYFYAVLGDYTGVVSTRVVNIKPKAMSRTRNEDQEWEVEVMWKAQDMNAAFAANTNLYG